MKNTASALVIAVVASGYVAPASAQGSAKPTGDTAVLSWAAFDCSMYAEMAGEPASERERLFKLGYEAGKRFLEAARAGAIGADEIKEKVPIGFSMHAAGPTVDFSLGRIYEAATNDAYDRIVKHDAAGVPLAIDKWQTDDEIKKIRGQNEYRNRNCALLK